MLILVPTYFFVRLHTQLIETDSWAEPTVRSETALTVKQSVQVDNDSGSIWFWGGAGLCCGGSLLFFLYPLFLVFFVNHHAGNLPQDTTYIQSGGPPKNYCRALLYVLSPIYSARYWVVSLLGLLPALVIGDFWAVIAGSYNFEVAEFNPVPLAQVSWNLVGSSFFALAIGGVILFCAVVASVLPLWLKRSSAIVVSLLLALALNITYWWAFFFSDPPGFPSYAQLFMKGRDTLVFLWSDVQFPPLIAFTLAPYALALISLVLAAWYEFRKNRSSV